LWLVAEVALLVPWVNPHTAFLPQTEELEVEPAVQVASIQTIRAVLDPAAVVALSLPVAPARMPL
jgi:hypothetical protein